MHLPFGNARSIAWWLLTGRNKWGMPCCRYHAGHPCFERVGQEVVATKGSWYCVGRQPMHAISGVVMRAPWHKVTD
jgi:hypothetical protein